MSALSVATVRRWNSSYLSFIWPSYSTAPSYQFCTLKAPLTESKADSDSSNPSLSTIIPFAGCVHMFSLVSYAIQGQWPQWLFSCSLFSQASRSLRSNRKIQYHWHRFVNMHNCTTAMPLSNTYLTTTQSVVFFFSLGRPVWFWGKFECVFSSFALLLSWYKNSAATQW